MKLLPNPKKNLQFSPGLIAGENGSQFGIYLRKHVIKKMDFSIGLRVVRKSSDIVLIRCNGWHGAHPNKLHVGTPFSVIPPNTCHVHVATHAYLDVFHPQEPNSSFAQVATGYNCFGSALQYFLEEYGFVDPKTGKQLVKSPLLNFGAP